jgi:hypothetical protein
MADNLSLLGGRMPTQQQGPKLSTVLQGLQAAYTGQGPQFQQQMRAEEQQRMQNVMGGLQLEDALTKSAAQDALRIQQLAKTGDTRQAMDILGDRVQLLQQIGADTTSTMRLVDSLMSGGFDAILPQIDSTVEMGVRTGMIEPFGGQVPSTFRSLELQAEAAGLTPGTPDYQEFMSYRGFEGRMGAAKTINYKNGTFVTKPRVGPPEVYDRTGTLITDAAEKQRVLDAAIESGIVYESDLATGVARAKGAAETARELIGRAVPAAESTAVLKRSLDLLDRVDTGTFADFKLAVTDFFDVTGADAGELSQNLSRAVLSQLRVTFGAAFTEDEGRRLENISARFSQNNEVNRSLLRQALVIAENTARRGIQRAREEGDEATAQDIEDLLEFDLSAAMSSVEQPAGQPTGPRVIRFDENGNPIPD